MSLPEGAQGSSLDPFTLPDTPPRPASTFTPLFPESPPPRPRPGSSLNPFLLPDTPPPPPPAPAERLIIFKGPPSTIIPHVRRPRTDENARRAPESQAEQHPVTRRYAELRAAAGLPSTRARRPILALEAELASTSRRQEARGGRRPLGRITGRIEPRGGHRFGRLYALESVDLWRDGVGPPEMHAKEGKEHTQCGVCLLVKSHPVSYLCGHSHCYVCVRLWLEREWTCPHCTAPMYRAPFRHYAEEASLESEYPEWNDTSVVDYSFAGLSFPVEPTE